MQRLTHFLWICSGADLTLLKKSLSEGTKYAGIGATIFFTGLLAAASGGYALFTVFDNIWFSLLFGAIWGLLIFNLDRFIVSSMRKEGKPAREILLALPRLILAVVISIVIAKPLELKIFEKEITPEIAIMSAQKHAELEGEAKRKFTTISDSLKGQILFLQNEIQQKAQQRDALIRAAQEEADGTGGSRRRNAGPIYKIKKADADRAQKELDELRAGHELLIQDSYQRLNKNDSAMAVVLNGLKETKLDGLAGRIEAMARITEENDAIYWAHVFIILLFISVEIAPVLVKLISPRGPYDQQLRTVEHQYEVDAIKDIAAQHQSAKENAASFAAAESEFVNTHLNTYLGKFS